LIPTLIEFSSSKEPQVLVNFLAKVLRKAKKQTWFINTIKYILQSIKFPRSIGYKVILTGRINSKKKSRLIFIMRKQITLQIFDNHMNFAYAQARARIGTFGIKVWVYFRKNRKNEKNNSVTSK
jgi:ribosomal protein S3